MKSVFLCWWVLPVAKAAQITPSRRQDAMAGTAGRAA